MLNFRLSLDWSVSVPTSLIRNYTDGPLCSALFLLSMSFLPFLLFSFMFHCPHFLIFCFTFSVLLVFLKPFHLSHFFSLFWSFLCVFRCWNWFLTHSFVVQGPPGLPGLKGDPGSKGEKVSVALFLFSRFHFPIPNRMRTLQAYNRDLSSAHHRAHKTLQTFKNRHLLNSHSSISTKDC